MKRLTFLCFLIVGLAANFRIEAQQLKPDVVSLEGQLVCSVCWYESDRKTTPYGTPEDLTCAAECAEKGIPPALAVKDGDNYKIFIIEEGTFKRSSPDWSPDVLKQVRLQGRVRTEKNKHYIAVDRMSILAESIVSAARQAAIGTEAELQLKDLFGVDQKLSSYRGRIVILNFWATWCVPCKDELPDLVAIQNDYAALGVQVIGAAADELADRAKVMKFIKEMRINFPVWLGLDTSEMQRFGVGPSLPATIIVGRDGKIDTIYPGVIKSAEVRKRLDAMLNTDALALKAKPESTDHPRDVSLVPS